MDVNTTQAPVTNSQESLAQAPGPITAQTDQVTKGAQDAQAGEPPAKEPEAPKQDDKFSRRFAALTRQEKQLQKERSEWKAKMEAEQKSWEEKLTRAKTFEETRSKAKTDRTFALKALEDLGLSYDEITQLVLNDNKPTAEMMAKQAQEQVEQLRREREEERKRIDEERTRAQQAQEEAIIKGFKNDISQTIEKNAEAYELTQRHPNGVELVYQVIDHHFNQTKRVLSMEEALQHVESFLDQEITDKVLSTKKIQKRMGQAPKADTDGAGDARARDASDGVPPRGAINDASARGAVRNGTSESPKTLSNSVQTGAPTPTDSKPMTIEESLARAAKMLKWN